MKYKCTFINDIHGLEIEEPFNLNLLESHNLKISNDPEFISDFYTKETKQIAGLGQYEKSAKLGMYLSSYFTTEKNGFNAKEILSYLLQISTILSNSLWLIKDSSIRFQTGHLKYHDNKIVTIDSNSSNSLYSNKIGHKNTTIFTISELNKAIEYFNFFFNLNLIDKYNEPRKTYASVNRLKRAYYFIDLARLNFDIGTKVSLFCSSLECLFSVSNSELKHRLSETIANLLGKNSHDKLQLYSEMKSIYDLRSSVTHGSGISKKLCTNEESKLREIGENCDNIVRKCILKILSDKTLKEFYDENKDISNYLLELNFH